MLHSHRRALHVAMGQGLSEGFRLFDQHIHATNCVVIWYFEQEKLLWPCIEFRFASRMVVHWSHRIFCLKTFPSYKFGIPPLQRHFVVYIQSNNQCTKHMLEVELMWGHSACGHHGRPLVPVKLRMARSHLFKMECWHMPALALHW